MATYKGIQGYSVQSLSSDPTAANVEGQLWYNSSSGKFKIAAAGAGAWASGDALNEGRENLAGIGTVTAALAVGGRPGYEALNESYNGSAWTEVGDINTPRFGLGGAGTQTAAIVYGGEKTGTTNTDESETWNGTSWTETGDMNDARVYIGSFGTATAAVGATGAGDTDASEEYDGTSWASGNAVQNPRYGVSNSGAGTLTDGLITGGGNPPSSFTESYDGTTWTEEADSGLFGFCGGAGATGSAMVAWAGELSSAPWINNKTQTWNGSAWTEVADYVAYVGNQTGCGTQTAALSIGGGPGGVTTTFVWDGAPIAAKTVTVS